MAPARASPSSSGATLHPAHPRDGGGVGVIGRPLADGVAVPASATPSPVGDAPDELVVGAAEASPCADRATTGLPVTRSDPDTRLGGRSPRTKEASWRFL